MLLNPFISYITETKTTFSFSMDNNYDWLDNQWTVPVQLGVSQLLKIGQQPMSFGLAGRYYTKAPAGNSDWALRFTMTLIFP